MPRLYTRTKRRKNLGTSSQKHRFWKGNVEGRKRMKSFATEEKAKTWGSAEKLTDEHYELRQHPGGKWQWRAKNKYLHA